MEKLGGWEREKGSNAGPKLPLRFTAEVDVDSFTKWLSHDLQAQTVLCARQAVVRARESQLCVEECC